MDDTKRDNALIDELRARSAETTWIEFKTNLDDADKIGRLISAMSNSARLEERDSAFIVWGIKDGSHDVVGTSFDPFSKRIGNQNFELWLQRKLSPAPALEFRKVSYEMHSLIILEIPPAVSAPTAYEGVPYIRIGSATPKLSDDHYRYQALIEKLRPYSWESGVAKGYLSDDEVLDLLDHDAYQRLTSGNPAMARSENLSRFSSERLTSRDVGGRWNILNLGAILFARDLNRFGPSLARKGVRFVKYSGSDRTTQVTHRHDMKLGYAVGCEDLLSLVNGLLPQNEHIGQALRTSHPLFPKLSLRELIANALIHQDMTIGGAGPLIELFQDRIEITNPGKPLIDTDRMIDQPPRSRNEAIASLMRRIGICEEQGSGLDKVFRETEIFQLPAPLLRSSDASMQAVIYGPRRFAEMTNDERVRACYFHAVLKFLAGDRMTNSSLCERFGIHKRNAAQASSVLKKAMEADLIKFADEDHPRAGYYPWWA